MEQVSLSHNSHIAIAAEDASYRIFFKRSFRQSPLCNTLQVSGKRPKPSSCRYIHSILGCNLLSALLHVRLFKVGCVVPHRCQNTRPIRCYYSAYIEFSASQHVSGEASSRSFNLSTGEATVAPRIAATAKMNLNCILAERAAEYAWVSDVREDQRCTVKGNSADGYSSLTYTG